MARRCWFLLRWKERCRRSETERREVRPLVVGVVWVVVFRVEDAAEVGAMKDGLWSGLDDRFGSACVKL